MTNAVIVPQTITEVEVDALRATWDAACEAERATWHGSDLSAVRAAHSAERAAHAAWKAGERALQDMWLIERAADEEARLQAMCEEHDAMEEEYSSYDVDYMYHLTTAGMSYLDHHYHQDSDGGHEMLAVGGESPYGDGTTGWVQPTPAHPCYTNGVCDMDALSRYEDLAY